jgi:uncharacterized protein (TIGR03437 family)
MVPYEVAGQQRTMVQYEYNGIRSNTVTVPVAPAAPGIFAADATGRGQGYALNQDNSPNTADNPAARGAVVRILSTGGGTNAGAEAADGAIAPSERGLALPLTATIGGAPAPVVFAGQAPGRIQGILRVDLIVPEGIAGGPQPVFITVGGVASQDGVTVAVK